MSSPKDIVEVDPTGDTVLAVGKNPPVLMRMSSSVLIRVSKVFEVMLKGSFSEGQTQHTTENPLKLPDDNGHAVGMMCKLLMQQFTDIRDIKPRDLPGLTSVCDKYQCLNQLRIWIQMGLTQCLLDDKTHLKASLNDKSVNIDAICILDALAIAYLIDDAAHFKQLSHRVMAQCSGNTVRNEMNKGLADIMPAFFRSEWVSNLPCYKPLIIISQPTRAM